MQWFKGLADCKETHRPHNAPRVQQTLNAIARQ